MYDLTGRSAFFFFCGEFRGEIKGANPDFTVGDVAKQLGKRWEKVTDRSKYEKQAADDKVRYEKAMQVYNKGVGGKGEGARGKAMLSLIHIITDV